MHSIRISWHNLDIFRLAVFSPMDLVFSPKVLFSPKDYVKILGVLMDAKLKYKEHIARAA